jgi:hypothetical protein
MYITPSLIHTLKDMKRFEQCEVCINTAQMRTPIVQSVTNKIMPEIISTFPNNPEKCCIVGIRILFQ